MFPSCAISRAMLFRKPSVCRRGKHTRVGFGFANFVAFSLLRILMWLFLRTGD